MAKQGNRTRHASTPQRSAQNTPHGADGVPRTAESTLPPTSVQRLLEGNGVGIYVLSTDDELLRVVQAAGGEQYPIHPVQDGSELSALVEGGLCRIVVLDAETLSGGVEQRIAELRARAPSLVIVVAASRETTQSLIGLLAERLIHRLLIKPAAVGSTRLLLESAVGRYLALREQTAGRELEMAFEPPPGWAPASSGTKWPGWLLAVAIVSLLIGGAIVGGLSRVARMPLFGTKPPASAAAPAPAQQTPLPELDVENAPVETVQLGEPAPLADAPADDTRVEQDVAPVAPPAGGTSPPAAALDAAEASEQASAATEPPLAAPLPAPPPAGAPAELSPAAAPAAAAPTAPPTELDSLLAIGGLRLEAGQLLVPSGDGALDYLQRAARSDPNDPRVLALRAQLAAAIAARARLVLERGDFDDAQALIRRAFELGADQETLTALDIELAAAREKAADTRRAAMLASARAHLRDGRLIAPANDSALYLLNALRAQAPDFPGLAEASSQLVSRLADAANAAVESGRWSDADRWISGLADAGAQPSFVESLRESAEAGQRQEAYLATAVPIGQMRIIEAGTVAYPPDAQRHDIEGWVDLQFVVGRDGLPRNARVVGADPAGWFEDAALESISRYRFEPFEQDGRRYERLVSARVRFGLQ
jgi:protein TonB